MLTSNITALLGSKLQIIPGAALAGISAVSVPTTFAVYGTQKESGIFTNQGLSSIKGSLNQITESIRSHFESVPQLLKKEYEKALEKGRESFTQASIEGIGEQWKKGQEASQTVYEYIKDNYEDINYYTFTLGNLVKSTLKLFPAIIKDTIVYNDTTKRSQQLLSIQKMIAVSRKVKFSEFVSSIWGIVQKHHQTLHSLTMDDGLGALKILREISEDNYDTFMNRVVENANRVEGNESYSNSTELLKDLFIGNEEVQKLNGNIQSLKESLDSLKSKLSSVKGEDIEKLKAILEGLKGKVPSTKPSNS